MFVGGGEEKQVFAATNNMRSILWLNRSSIIYWGSVQDKNKQQTRRIPIELNDNQKPQKQKSKIGFGSRKKFQQQQQKIKSTPD